ncbi:MAG: D-inositol-3-phosphate glycosyltransferase [Elusimicrobia bacterium]|nr:D-inositol-3-phosphate glycosyltransferase [Elusimicrobiota bacterium]
MSVLPWIPFLISTDKGWNGRNILVNLPSWDPTFWATNVGKLIRGLVEHKAKVTVFCRKTPLLKDLLETPGVRVFSYKNPSFRFVSFLKCLLLNKFQLVLWTYNSYRENLLLALWRAAGKVRYVIKCDSLKVNPRPGLRGKAGFSIFKWINRSADLVLVETTEIQEWARSFLSSEKIFFMPNGVPKEMFSRLLQKFRSEQPSSPRPYFLTSRRISHEKGIDLLIEAFAMIAPDHPEWDLSIVGPVRDQAYYEKCLQLVRSRNLEQRIFFRGYLSGEALYRQYFFSEIFVLPSRLEGLANVITEAMFFYNPLVAFDTGQTASLVNDKTGVLVPAERVDLLAKAMKDLAVDPPRRHMLAAAAHALVSEQYNDDVMFPNLLRACAQVVFQDSKGQ